MALWESGSLVNEQEFSKVIDQIAELVTNAADGPAVKRILHKEILGIIQVHNDDVRQAVTSVILDEARKWHKKYGDDPFDKRYWEAFFDAERIVALAPLPGDVPGGKNSN